jgi:DNA-directed RNA polymerase subunit alpha
MIPVVDTELKDIVLSNNSFGPNEIKVLSRRISDDYSQFPVLRDLTNELESQTSRSPASSVRLGVCQYLLGRYRSAIQTLESADGGALAYLYQGRSHAALENYERAIDCYENAKKGGYDSSFCAVLTAEAKRLGGDAPAAMAILDNLFGPIEQTAEYLYQRAATISVLGTNPDEVVRLYSRAVDADEKHSGALFGLALENDRYGNDDKAIELYQRASAVFPTNLGALLNLGVMYEDYNQFQRAVRCYDRILESYPGHERARLYRRDALESVNGGDRWDDDRDRLQRKMQTVMTIPIAQFELSVRSRNCLQKMGIMTLGDLTKVTELELLNSKNFGETSLHEIREMMKNKGLVIGQFSNQKDVEPETFDAAVLSPEESVVLERPISDLNLSVRARKCMTRLGLTTIGELLRKSGDDLLECKNFGVTSLNEVREKLTQLGMKLRGE